MIRIVQLVTRLEFESWQEWQENFLQQSYFLCWYSLFGVLSIHVPPQWHVKDPSQVQQQITSKHTYTLSQTKTEWADYAVHAECGNHRKISLYATQQGMLAAVSSDQSGTSVHKPISTLKMCRRILFQVCKESHTRTNNNNESL